MLFFQSLAPYISACGEGGGEGRGFGSAGEGGGGGSSGQACGGQGGPPSHLGWESERVGGWGNRLRVCLLNAQANGHEIRRGGVHGTYPPTISSD